MYGDLIHASDSLLLTKHFALLLYCISIYPTRAFVKVTLALEFAAASKQRYSPNLTGSEYCLC